MKRKPRALVPTPPPDALLTVPKLDAARHALWLQIKTEFITSIEAPSIEDLGRKYVKQIGVEALKKRCSIERWPQQRAEWWEKAEVTLLQKIQDEYLVERLREMEQIRRAMPFVFEHLMPVTEKDSKTGERTVKREPESGLPIFAHGFRSQDAVVKTWLLLQERQMLLRGEATARTESQIKDRSPEIDLENSDPLALIAAKSNFSAEEVRSLARTMIQKRMRAEAGEEEDDPAAIETEGSSGDEEEEI